MDASCGHLRTALLAGDAESAGETLAADPALAGWHDPDRFGASTMVLAVHGRSTDCIDLLLEHGASPDDKSDWWAGGFSPLYTAVQAGWHEGARHLIARGATVTAYEAAAMGDLDRLSQILDQDPQAVHGRHGDGQTPLHVAADPETAALLLERGADIEARCVDHVSTPLQYLTEKPPVAQFLLERGAQGDPVAFASVPDTRWLRRMLEDDPSKIGFRVSRQAFPTVDPKLQNIYMFTVGEGCTLLHVAAMRGNVEAARLLLRLGADPNATGGYDDSTPLHAAAWRDMPGTVRALAEAGAEIDKPSGPAHRNTPLGWAVVAGAANAVEALLAAGAQVRRHILEDAEAGLAGEFAWVRHLPPENRLRVLSLLRGA